LDIPRSGPRQVEPLHLCGHGHRGRPPLPKRFRVIRTKPYEDTVTWTYLAAAKHMILAEGSLECLQIAGTDNSPGVEPTEPDIPSWVPDLYAFTQASTHHLYFAQ